MMKKVFRVLLIICICAIPTSVNAATVKFRITVGGNHPDTISPRALKNPYDSDNNFYVTGHTFSNPNELVIAKSFHLQRPDTYFTLYGTTIKSYKDSASYYVRVPHNEYYYMNTEFANGSGTVAEITGNYTP